MLSSLINRLWETYYQQAPQMQQVVTSLQQKAAPLVLDHFAVIDLPGPHTGIPVLSALFSALGYHPRGQGYLPSKQNDFHWLADARSLLGPANAALPQAVVADFRLAEMPSAVSAIIKKYAQQAPPAPLALVQTLAIEARQGNASASMQLQQVVLDYFRGRDWPLPSIAEFKTVHAFNELLAWVLVFGRRPNHFTISAHLLNGFASLTELLDFVRKDLQLPLNQEGGEIKGSAAVGIAQGATMGVVKKVVLTDGEVELPMDFVEFVWRYPVRTVSQPALWQDYFTGFVAENADNVIKSLLVQLA